MPVHNAGTKTRLLMYTPELHCKPANITCRLAYFARWHCMPASTTCLHANVPTGSVCPLATLQDPVAMSPLATTRPLALHAC